MTHQEKNQMQVQLELVDNKIKSTQLKLKKSNSKDFDFLLKRRSMLVLKKIKLQDQLKIKRNSLIG